MLLSVSLETHQTLLERQVKESSLFHKIIIATSIVDGQPSYPMISEYVRLKMDTNKIRPSLPEIDQHDSVQYALAEANGRQHNVFAERKHTKQSKLPSFKSSTRVAQCILGNSSNAA